MAKILIADIAQGAERLKSILLADHAIEYAKTVQEATSIASNANDFDLIIVGLMFDDSRMYELIEAIKNVPALRGTPVMGFSDKLTAMSQAGRDSIENVSHWLGACDYVDTENLTDTEISQRIENCLQQKQGVGRRREVADERPSVKRVRQQKERD